MRELTIKRHMLCNYQRVWKQTYLSITLCNFFYTIFHSDWQTGYGYSELVRSSRRLEFTDKSKEERVICVTLN